MKDYSRRKKQIPDKFKNLNIYSNDKRYLKNKIRALYLSSMPFSKSTAQDYYDYYKYLGGKLTFNQILKGGK